MTSQVKQNIKDAEKYYSIGDYNLALKSLVEALKQDPQNSKVYLMLASIYANTGDRKRAAEFINKVIELSQNNSGNLVEATRLLNKIGLKDAGKELIKNALKINDQCPKANSYLAIETRNIGKYDEALEHAEIVLKSERGDIKSFDLVASVYEKMGNIEKVKELASQVNAKFKGKEFLYSEVKALMNEKKYDKAIEHIKKFITRYNYTKNNFHHIMIELANCYDKAGEYEEAYKHIIEGKKSKKKILENNRKNGYVDLMDIYLDYFNKNKDFQLPKNKFSAKTDDPIFIVGFPRSGTTLVEQVLYSSDNLFTIDETGFITSVCTENGTKQYKQPNELLEAAKSEEEIEKGRKIYLDKIKESFGDLPNGRRIIDKMPTNTILIPVIKTYFPSAKIIMVIRDPRDTIISCLFQDFTMDNVLDFDTGVEVYNKVMGLVDSYKEIFGDDIYEAKYEDIVDDFENQAKKLYEFVGEEWTDNALKFHKKKREVYNKTPNRFALNQPLYKTSVAKWKNYEEFMKPYFPQIEKYIKKYGYEY